MEIPYITCAICVASSYLIGSLPFGFWISKFLGVDIRNHGSGNIGATNVLRMLGRKIGVTVFLLDVAKGFVPVWIGTHVILSKLPENLHDTEHWQGGIPVILALAAIIGHNYTFCLGFKGGKGIATSAGVMIAFIPVVLLGFLVTWIIVFCVSRYVAIASIVAACSIPLLTVLLDHNYLFPEINSSYPVICFGVIAALMAIWRHRSNIQRLMKGEEDRFERGRKTKSS